MAKQQEKSLSADGSMFVDTSKAPWMAVAENQIGKKEFRTTPSFLRLLYLSAVQVQVPTPLKSAKDKATDLMKETVIKQLAGQRGTATAAARHSEVNKYLSTVKTDPHYGGKSTTLPVVGTYGDPKALALQGETAEWESTAWCAAFVNWCLLEAKSPCLGYATAASWLRFGTPLASPVPGCVTIMPPGSGGGSGHVAFLVEKTANGVLLLGGNQRQKGKKGEPDEVNKTWFKSKPLGYRWPTPFDHQRLGSTQTV